MTTDKPEKKSDEARDRESKPTDRLEADAHDSIPLVDKMPFGTEIGSAISYISLPVHVARKGQVKDAPRWRIEMHDIAPGIGPLGLDVLGDVVMGRGAGGPLAPDLDMDIFGGFERGVSRRHALLRPTINHLYIIDLGSTNGTLHNAVRLGPGVARALTHNDTLTLGKLTFTLKIIDGPGVRKRAAQEAAAPAASIAGAAPAGSDPAKTAPISQPVVPGAMPPKPAAGTEPLPAAPPKPEVKKAPVMPTSSRPTVKPERPADTAPLPEQQTKPIDPQVARQAAEEKVKQAGKEVVEDATKEKSPAPRGEEKDKDKPAPKGDSE